MQELHNAVYKIVERPDSEVITTCHVDESVRVQTPTDTDDLYAGFPIRVETANSKSQAKPRQPALSLGAAIALKKKVFAVNVKPLAKIAAVAAGILIVAALLLNTPTAKGVTIERIYKAIAKVKNVHITSLVPGEEKPIQDQWVSRDFKVHLIRTKEESVLWDIRNGTITVKRLDGGPIEAKPLSPEMIAQTKETITGYLGLVPFADLSVVPKGADWSRVSGDNLEVAAQEMGIYQLSWVEKVYDGSAIFWKWRVFVDPKTDLPQRGEFYRKSAPDVEYSLVSANVVEYLADDEMQAVIEGASF
jgi:hypothetical protein